MDACQKSGWTFNDNTRSCYKFMDTPATWWDALNTCWLEGGNLAAIESDYENKFVFGLAPGNGRNRHRGTDLWIGYSFRLSYPYGWVKVGGSQIPYTNWHRDQPDNKGGDQFCVLIWGWYQNDEWDDRVCTDEKKYVCKTSMHGMF